MRLRAYLVSGEFRVHRADCRDCEKEARRSDSAGDAEEYASRADVIAGLWSDIIAENPELYGTPGGLASLEAETIFLPCTSGLPGTSPAGDGGQPGDADELAAWAAGLGLEAGDLDDLVHDAYSRQASEVNNGGLGSQVRFLIESYGTGGARSLLSDLRPAAARRASEPAVQPRLRPARGSARRRLPASSACRLACCQAGPPRQRCPVTSKIPRRASLTCQEESVLSIFARQSVRFARFACLGVVTRDSEVCLPGRLGDHVGRFPGCMNVSASGPSAAGRGKLSGRRRR